MKEKEFTESMLFTQRMAQLSKALWKAIEKDWQRWIKPFHLNINEYHVLWIAHYLNGATISDVAKFGVMHVSTAFNFSKKLEERGFLTLSKRENDKRNTYIKLTDKGKNLLTELMDAYEPANNSVYQGSLPLRELYGKFPEVIELLAIVRNIYGKDFMDIFETSFSSLEKEFLEKENKSEKAEIEKVV
ncbi:HTH-type transcriptional regulator Hpr [Lederbergia sp. NSJ-179]|uniref:HTH-type transcriptional regulator Hpr n=1 Tax=Lederbergia sp. NSJ-179 TaxID=2931402 RepID=UPI001FD5D05C|nr:HTH-type transcriptional regulator Hpr [Lederbergia sp. NSJ-179]MCJ7840420.1 HTH-type transcriptional regulator Hpr [Lederbergia sp. NSJ-179]